MQSHWVQRAGGLFLFLLGSGITVWAWHIALTEGYYYRKVMALPPAFAVLGLGMLFFPIDAEQLRAEHGVDRPQKFAHYPPEWKVLFFVAVAAGLGNWYAIAHL
jgi:hypothetical protein